MFRTKKPKKDSKEARGRSITPGIYKAVFSYGKQTDSTSIIVKADPKLSITLAEMTQKAALIDQHYQNVQKVIQGYQAGMNTKCTTINLE